MIKKCISSTLALLVILNILGCYASRYVPNNDVQVISEGDEITVIDQEMKTYIMTVEHADINEIQGYVNGGENRTTIVIPTDQIDRIEIRRMDVGLMVTIGGIFFGAIVAGGIIIPIPQIK